MPVVNDYTEAYLMAKCKIVKDWCHCRIASPKKFDKRSFRTKVIKPGVQVVVGCRKGKWNPKGRIKIGGKTRLGRCKEGMKTQATRYSKSYLRQKGRRCRA